MTPSGSVPVATGAGRPSLSDSVAPRLSVAMAGVAASTEADGASGSGPSRARSTGGVNRQSSSCPVRTGRLVNVFSAVARASSAHTALANRSLHLQLDESVQLDGVLH